MSYDLVEMLVLRRRQQQWKERMNFEPPCLPESTGTGPALQVYLLGSVSFEAALNLQRRMAYQVSGDPESAAMILCEHLPLITVGREGSRNHILCEPEDLIARRWPVRWVNRGGGCLLHLPGQLAIYPIVDLEKLGLDLQGYLDRLHTVLRAVVRDFIGTAETRHGRTGVWANSRPIAGVGVAVCNGVTYHGAFLNVNADLQPFRRVLFGDRGDGPMTSLERERRGRVSPTLVRQSLLEHFTDRFHFGRTSLFFDHPLLGRKAPSDAVPASS
jgi:lipoyl(octanoyl) transferase